MDKEKWQDWVIDDIVVHNVQTTLSPFPHSPGGYYGDYWPGTLYLSQATAVHLDFGHECMVVWYLTHLVRMKCVTIIASDNGLSHVWKCRLENGDHYISASMCSISCRNYMAEYWVCIVALVMADLKTILVEWWQTRSHSMHKKIHTSIERDYSYINAFFIPSKFTYFPAFIRLTDGYGFLANFDCNRIIGFNGIGTGFLRLDSMAW